MAEACAAREAGWRRRRDSNYSVSIEESCFPVPTQRTTMPRWVPPIADARHVSVDIQSY